VPAHSVADWTYDVSKQIGAFTITGLIAFAVAKGSNVWDTVNQVEWATVLRVITTAIGVLATLLTVVLVIVQAFGTGG
jgi:hypothetical protein